MNKNADYDILTDTAGNLPEDIFKRYNIRMSVTPMTDMKKTEAFFKTSIDAGRDILYICMSGLQNAKIAAAELMAAHPGRRIICVEQPSYAYDGLKAVKLSRFRAAGATLDEVASYFEKHKQPSLISFPASRFSWPMSTAISI